MFERSLSNSSILNRWLVFRSMLTDLVHRKLVLQMSARADL
jgi:hypothetical protein